MSLYSSLEFLITWATKFSISKESQSEVSKLSNSTSEEVENCFASCMHINESFFTKFFSGGSGSDGSLFLVGVPSGDSILRAFLVTGAD